MKNITLIAIITFFSVNIFAQDKHAKAILDKLANKTKTYKTIKADFAFKLENKEDKVSDTYKGTVWVSGDKYKVDLMGAENYFDGKAKYTYLKESNEVNITEPDESDDDVLNPSKIFTMYTKNFKYKFVSDKFENTRTLQTVDLFPIDLEKEYSRIRLRIDKTKNQIFEITQYGKDGNTYTIRIIKFTPNVSLPATFFNFDKSKHKGVEVNDMR